MMLRLKISFVLGNFKIGGVERQTLSLVNALRPDRYEPHVLVLKNEGPIFAELAGSSEDLNLWTPNAAKGLDLGAIRRTARYIDEQSIDLVLASNQYATIFTRLVLFFCRRRPLFLCAFHSSPEHIDGTIRSRLQMALFKWSLRATKRVIFVSENQRSAWKSKGLLRGLESGVIHNGIDLEGIDAESGVVDRTSLSWTDDDFVIGLCAQMRVEKNIPHLIIAARRLIDKGARIKILLIGDGAERGNIESQISELLPANTVHITGFQKRVVPWLRMCDAVTLVSRAEAFSMVSLEAMACAKPLVLSNVGGAAEQVEEGVSGYLFEPGNIDELVQKLEKLISERSAGRMGAKGFERVRDNFSFGRMVDKYEALFAAVGTGLSEKKFE